MTEVSQLRDENHKLRLVVSTLEKNLDAMISDNKLLKSAIKEKDSAIENLKSSLANSNSQILEAKRQVAAQDRDHGRRILELQQTVSLKDKELALFGAKLKQTQTDLDNDVEKIKLKVSLESKYKDEITELKGAIDNLRAHATKSQSDHEKIVRQFESDIQRYEFAAKESATKHKREYEEFKAQIEKLEGQNEQYRTLIMEKELEFRRKTNELKLNLEFSLSELEKVKGRLNNHTQEKNEIILKSSDLAEKLREEKRALQTEFDKLNVEKTIQQNELLLKKAIFEKVESQLHQMIREKESLVNNLCEKDDKINELTTRICVLQDENRSNEMSLKKRIETELSNLKNLFDKEKQKNDELFQQNAHFKSQLLEREKTFDEHEVKLKTKVQELSSELGKSQAQLESLHGRVKELDITNHKLKLDIETVNRQISEKEKELERSKKFSEENFKDTKAYFETISRFQQTASIESELDKYKSKYESCKMKLQKANQKLVELLREKMNFWNPDVPMIDLPCVIDPSYNNTQLSHPADLVAPRISQSDANNRISEQFYQNHVIKLADQMQDEPRYDKVHLETQMLDPKFLSGNSYPSERQGKFAREDPSSTLKENDFIRFNQFRENQDLHNQANLNDFEKTASINGFDGLRTEYTNISHELNKFRAGSNEDRIRELISSGDRYFNLK